jgi:NO-binding membrane sensor protein with MHYT domain/signal transduction histidine kinase
MSSSATALTGSYDYLLVALSVFIAILAAYAALDFAGRVTAARGSIRLLRLTGGAVSMGVGIWSMHYIGMLAFQLPIPVRYDWPTVLLSLLAAILASAVALFVVSRQRMGVVRAALGSLVMGSGIAVMHYVGMEAMRMAALHTYSPSLVGVSVLLAIVISFVALWLTFHLRTDATAWSKNKLIAALVMGAAIPVMHYTGMAAVTFTPSTTHFHEISSAVSVSALGTVGIVLVTLLVLGMVPLANLKIDTLSHTRQLTVRHFLFLGVLGLLAVLGAVLVEQEGRQLRQHARLISTAGQQSMLSQTLAKDVLLLAATTEGTARQPFFARITETALNWQRSHEALKQSDPVFGTSSTNSDEVMRMFASLDAPYLAILKALRTLTARPANPGVPPDVSALVAQVLAYEQSYLQTMNQIADQYERESIARQNLRDRLYVGLIICLLGVLLLQGFVVLRPAMERIEHGIGELERTTQALHRQVSFKELLQSVAVAANEATSLEAALQFALDRICAHTGWPVGHVYFYTPGSTKELTSSSLWHIERDERFASLCDATQSTRLYSGMGVPARVVKTGKPAWIRDLLVESEFTEQMAAADLGVRGAFGFPVLVQGEVVAVLEFFSHQVEEPDEELLSVMSNVGTQLGQVVERTRAQQQIARNTEDLARSNAELEQFAYVASHDLQEPLRMVASFTQLLARKYQGRLDADADEYIRYAVDGAQRMQILILDLLSYARLSMKSQTPQPIDAALLCASAINQLRQSIQEKDAVVTVDPLPTVLGYSTQLTQLFQNLIGNSLKYCNQSRPEVHVSATSAGEHWVFSVRDNGIGIEPQYFERIFQMFKRLHTREQYSGTGIGLALCHKIVARHRGRIWVESQPGLGSNFQFTIPRAEGAIT